MAQKLFKVQKKKVTAQKGEDAQARKIVLVGTYAGDQLKDWPGYYPYPLYGDDKVDPEYCKKVNEIWLFKGTKEPKYFAAECLGVKTRDELKALGLGGKCVFACEWDNLFKVTKCYLESHASFLNASYVRCA